MDKKKVLQTEELMNAVMKSRRSYEEILPWDHLDYGVTKAFLKKESEKARQSVTTPNCRQACSGCGAACWKGGVCVENR